MKTNAFKLMAALFVAALSLGFTSCGDDDDNDGGSARTVTANIRNDNSSLYMNWEDEEGFSVHTGLSINDANNFEAYQGEIVCVGKVSGIGSIKKVPQSGWSEKCAVQPGYGYVLRSEGYSKYGYSDYRYVRIYVVDYMEGTSGGIIGATIKYQAPWDVR
ncbi:MAG: DUF5036 family protein [Alloprevotella sp.]|nr:DUF5036 family protein [Alloprevotella sp.]